MKNIKTLFHMKKVGVILASLVLLLCPLLTEAQPGPATATVALNLTITESLTIQVSQSSLTLTSGVLSSPVTATISYNFGSPVFLDYVSSVSGSFASSDVFESLNSGTTTACTNTFTGAVATSANGCHAFVASGTTNGAGSIPLTYQWLINAPSTLASGNYSEVVQIKAIAQ